MIRLKSIALLLIPVISIVACKKDSGTSIPADTAATIDISTPITGLTYLNGSNLSITGTIADNDVLATAKVEVRNKTTNAILFQQTDNTGNVGFYRYTWNWTISGITGPTPGNVKIISKDKYGRETSKEIDITFSN